MKPNPILEEVWRVKDELAREAGDDLHRLCENTRQWASAHPHPGPVAQSPEELHQLLAAETERPPAAQAPIVVRETPPKQH